MARQNTYLHAFNVGVIDKDKLTRIDLAKLRLAAETQDNMIPDTSGKMFFRPGFEYLSNSAVQADGWLFPFARSSTEAEVLEMTDSAMRVWSGDAPISRASVSSTITSGDFSSLTGWTTVLTGAAYANASGGVANLNAVSIGGRSTIRQQVTTSNAGVEHAVRIVVARGPVTLKIGSSSGAEDYVNAATLLTGTHSIAFTPSGSYWIEFYTEDTVERYIDSVTVESSGTVTIPSPWPSSALPLVRIAQSIDVLFCACEGYPPYRIERRSGGRSWSIVKYRFDDGPFTVGRTADVKLKPGANSGNTTLTADKQFFKSSHVGMLIRLFHTGQNYTQSINGDGSSTRPIRISGVYNSNATGSDRYFTHSSSGTWSGYVSIERSVDDEESGYHEVRYSSTNSSDWINDGDSNVVKWVRMSFRSGNYTSGYAVCTMTYEGGGNYGIARIMSINSDTEANIEILTPFSNTTYTTDWRLGEFGAAKYYPSSVALFDGRLWWFGQDRIWGSVSDAFDSFDEEITGDSAPISRSIATGGLNNVRWSLGLQRLVMGTDGGESSARSSSLDEPLTASNITIRDASTVGSASVAAVRIDSRGIFVDRPGTTLFEVLYDAGSYDYTSAKLSKLSSSLFASGVKQLAVMRRPETRVFAVMNDGTLNMVVYEPQQEVAAFVPIKTRSGDLVKSIAIIPGTEQDRVYARILRTLNGSQVYTVERMAMDTETTPDTLCKCLDSFKTGTNAPASATITGLSHLNGETVYAWADGTPYGPFTVSGGSITLPASVSQWVVGLRYGWRYKSGRMAYAAQAGTPMSQVQRIDHLGLILGDHHKDGIFYGSEFDNPDRPLDALPSLMGDLSERPDVTLDNVTDEISLPFDGGWGVAPRVCLEGYSPYPAHVLGLVVTLTTNDRI